MGRSMGMGSDQHLFENGATNKPLRVHGPPPLADFKSASLLSGSVRRVFAAGMVRFSALCAGLLAGQMLAYTIEPKWGEPVNSLRIGIAADMTSPSESRLVVLIENTGPSKLTVLIGGSGGG